MNVRTHAARGGGLRLHRIALREGSSCQDANDEVIIPSGDAVFEGVRSGDGGTFHLSAQGKSR